MFILICLIILNKHYSGILSVISIRYVTFLRQLKEIEGRKNRPIGHSLGRTVFIGVHGE